MLIVYSHHRQDVVLFINDSPKASSMTTIRYLVSSACNSYIFLEFRIDGHVTEYILYPVTCETIEDVRQ